MGLSLIPKGGDHPREIYNVRIYLAAVCAAAAAIMIGYDSAFFGTSISLTSFKQEFGWTKKTPKELADLSANIVTIYQAGAFGGAALAYPMAYYGGRKFGMVFAAVITVLGAGLMCGANSSRGDALIFAGRAIAGVGVGTASSLAPLYLGEVSPAPIRGQLIGFYEIGWQIGGLIGFWINYAVSKNMAVSRAQWLTPFAVQLIPAGLFALTVPFFSPESPRWLLQRGRTEKALKNLCYLRKLPADHPYLQEEMAQMQASVDADAKDVGTGCMAPIKGIFSRWFLTRRLLLTTSLFLFQNGTGINAVNYYSPTFFRSIGLTGERTPLLTTGVFGVIKTIGALLWAFWWVDRYGRKAVLVVGSIGGAVGMLAIAAILGATNPAGKTPAPTSLPPSGGAAVAFFYIWTAFYAIGWNGTPWVVNSESFPGSVRLVSSTAGAMSNWLWNFVIARATPTMFLKMGHSGYGVYMFFGLMQVVSIIYVVYLLPETKNVPLEYMDTLFEKYKRNPRTAHRKTMEEVENDRAPTTAETESRDDEELKI